MASGDQYAKDLSQGCPELEGIRSVSSSVYPLGESFMTMSKLILSAAVFAAAALPLATSASAQSAYIREGDNAVVIRRHHDNGWHRGWEHRHYNSYGMQGCRTVTIRRTNDMGDTVIKRIRRCG
jgi:hypothetical protein